jgi:hypothetical protein
MPKKAEIRDEGHWLKWVALTTTCLAVMAAIGSLKSGKYSTRTQILTTQESNRWSYFQSKSIKQHMVEFKIDMLKVDEGRAQTPEEKARIAGLIGEAEKTVARYDGEMRDIRKSAEALSAEQDDLKRRGGSFSLSVMLFQIGIMLSAVGSLMKIRHSWYAGLAIGLVAIVYFLNGFFLFLA